MAINQIIYDDTTILASKMMDLSVARQEVLSNNLANASTPGYVRKDLEFQKQLTEQINNSNVGIGNLNAVEPEIVDDRKEPARLDGNNVNVATELNQLMQNGVLFNLLSRAYSVKMNILRSAYKNSV